MAGVAWRIETGAENGENGVSCRKLKINRNESCISVINGEMKSWQQQSEAVAKSSAMKVWQWRS
jgi:hypothetical protein